MTIADLYLAYDEAKSNYERASQSWDDMNRTGCPASCLNHMNQSMRTWGDRMRSFRRQIEEALTAEGAASVEIITEPTPAERRRTEAETPVTITLEQLDNLVWLAENQMREVEQRAPRLNGASGGERAARKSLLLKSAATLRELRTAVVS